MRLSVELSREVRLRAKGHCQYCLMHESLQGATFHIEHVIPQCRDGSSQLNNLVLACPGCNLHKADKTSAIDPASSKSTPLFNPILQRWTEHFRFIDYQITGLTPEGRATVNALNLNHPRRRRIRMAEEIFGLYPPLSE